VAGDRTDQPEGPTAEPTTATAAQTVAAEEENPPATAEREVTMPWPVL